MVIAGIPPLETSGLIAINCYMFCEEYPHLTTLIDTRFIEPQNILTIAVSTPNEENLNGGHARFLI